MIDRGLSELDTHKVDSFEKDFLNRGRVRKTFEKYETEEKAKFDIQSLSQGRN